MKEITRSILALSIYAVLVDVLSFWMMDYLKDPIHLLWVIPVSFVIALILLTLVDIACDRG